MKTESYKDALLPSLVIISIIALAMPLLSTRPVRAALTSHAPIYINGNGDFTSLNGITSGSGTPSDPYVVEGWAINVMVDNGIKISNTTAYFIIRNCLVENGTKNFGIYIGLGIVLNNVTNGKIEYCICNNNREGIYLVSSSNNTLNNNSCFNNYSGGIDVLFSSNNALNNNICHNSYMGISLGYSTNNTLTNNTSSGNNDTGIVLSSLSSNNTLENNTCSNNRYYGIDIESSDNNLISGNTVESNYWDGIHIGGSNNIVTNNICKNNLHGIRIYFNNNRICHNDFVNNTEIQAWDEGDSNYWDNGFPSGGNYWSDYTGIDADGDGIGDTPYYIKPSSNIDRYPLMTPSHLISGVSVSISPSSQSGASGAALAYAVTITNMGIDTDEFTLTVSDTRGWGANLTITSTTLAAGESRTDIGLSITIPSTAAGGDSTTITVTAAGTGYDNSATCTAKVTIARGVVVSISPSENSAMLGENVTFIITVTNTGNVADDYNMTVGDNTGWGPTLSDNSFLEVEKGASRITTLTIAIPKSAENGAQDRIMVTARSRTDDAIENSATCTVTAIKPFAPSGGGSTLVYIGVAVVIVVIIAAVLMLKVV